MNIRAEIWQNGAFVAGCDVHVDRDRVSCLHGTDKPIANGDYEIRRGLSVDYVTFSDGQCTERDRSNAESDNA